MSIELLQDYNVLDRVFPLVTYTQAYCGPQLMNCTCLMPVTHSYSICDLIRSIYLFNNVEVSLILDYLCLKSEHTYYIVFHEGGVIRAPQKYLFFIK